MMFRFDHTTTRLHAGTEDEVRAHAQALLGPGLTVAFVRTGEWQAIEYATDGQVTSWRADVTATAIDAVDTTTTGRNT